MEVSIFFPMTRIFLRVFMLRPWLYLSYDQIDRNISVRQIDEKSSCETALQRAGWRPVIPSVYSIRSEPCSIGMYVITGNAKFRIGEDAKFRGTRRHAHYYTQRLESTEGPLWRRLTDQLQCSRDTDSREKCGSTEGPLGHGLTDQLQCS